MLIHHYFFYISQFSRVWSGLGMEMNGKNQIYLFNIYFLSINFSQLRVVGCIFMAYGMARSGRNFFYFIGKKIPKISQLMWCCIDYWSTWYQYRYWSLRYLSHSIRGTSQQWIRSRLWGKPPLLGIQKMFWSLGCFRLTNHGILGEYKSSLGTCLSSIERPRIKVYPAYQRQLLPRRS